MTSPYFVTKSPKSVGIAILLTFLFGPIGLFYASVTGGLIMTFTPIALALLAIAGIFQNNALLLGWSISLLIICASTFWLINIIWAVISVMNYNEEIEEDAKRQNYLLNSLYQTTPNPIISNFHPKPSEVNTSGRQTTEDSSKPNLQEWLKSNPGKSINDYFVKFGR
jgi:hypothetical protein